MQTTDRLFFAFLIAVAAGWIFISLWGEWKRRRLLGRLPPSLSAAETALAALGKRVEVEEICRQVVSKMAGCVMTAPDRIQLFHRGLRGRCDFISDKTEMRLETGNLIQQVVEVVPAGWWDSRPRARGSRPEYDRIFQHPSQEGVLFNIGASYELRFSPDGLTLRLHSLPGSAVALAHWIDSFFRVADLIPGVEVLGRVEVTDVKYQVAEDSACQVCGAPLAGAPIVRCEKCRTPHHEDCWEYAKKCSTFGCTGDRCVR